MNEVTVHKSNIPSLQMEEDELINVLRNSLYPGAQTDSIKLVRSYCKAAGLDPMQKPVHIVPMWDGKLKTTRDTIMPGIGLYRTQAARTGECAGITEPEFGPDVTEKLDGVEITYPKWCKIIVKRVMASGQIAEYPAKELWKENYAMKGGQEKSIAPNAMWTKRPYGQLAKCAEAQAWRKAFPELGAAPTAEEMDGKSFDDAQTINVIASDIKKLTTPQAAVDSTVPDGYEQYESVTLPLLKEAANKGYEELTKAFKDLVPSPLKTALWTKHGASLKAGVQANE